MSDRFDNDRILLESELILASWRFSSNLNSFTSAPLFSSYVFISRASQKTPIYQIIVFVAVWSTAVRSFCQKYLNLELLWRPFVKSCRSFVKDMSRRDPFSHGPAKDSPVENSIALVRIRKFFDFFGSNKTLKLDIFQFYQTIFFLWSFSRISDDEVKVLRVFGSHRKEPLLHHLVDVGWNHILLHQVFLKTNQSQSFPKIFKFTCTIPFEIGEAPMLLLNGGDTFL